MIAPPLFLALDTGNTYAKPNAMLIPIQPNPARRTT
jgi:hypothetical protein